MHNISNTPKPTASVIALFSLMFLGLLVFVTACGNSSSTTGATSTPTTAAVTSSTATDTSGNDTGYGGGRYGNGGVTPTATKAATGPTQNALITFDSTGTFTFSPTSLTIKVGTTVTWKNTTQTPHTVTSDDGTTFNSGISTPISPGMTFSFTFTKAGTFTYHCDFHPYMKATIVVK